MITWTTVVPTKSDSDAILLTYVTYTPPDPTRIDRSMVYYCYPADRINTQVIYQ